MAVGNRCGQQDPEICFIGNIPEMATGLINMDAKLDETGAKIVIEPMKEKKKHRKAIEKKFISQVKEFIAKYEPALKALAKK